MCFSLDASQHRWNHKSLISPNFFSRQTLRVSEAQQLLIPVSVTPMAPPIALGLPFSAQGDAKVKLLTQVGGLTQDPTKGTDPCGYSGGYVDTCHTPTEAYWALDFKNPDPSQKVNVVAAVAGNIVKVEAVNEGTKESGPIYYPKIVIKDTSIKGDYYSIYQEFATFPGAIGQSEAINSVVAYRGDGRLLCQGATCQTNNVAVNQGDILGQLTGGAGLNHLHFQMGYGCLAAHDYKGCSTSSAPLSNVQIGGEYMKQFKLANSNNWTIVQTAPGYDTKNGRYAGSFVVTSTPNAKPPEGCYINNGAASCEIPLVPDVIDNKYTFTYTAEPDRVVYIDPAIAEGYDYQIQSGPLFASAVFPLIGDGLYDLWLFDSTDGAYEFGSQVHAGVPLDFGPSGVDRFRITGIDPSAAIDPNDPFAFVTGLTFTGPGAVSFTQTPLSSDVPEPGTLALLVPGTLALGLLRWCRRGKGFGEKRARRLS